MGAGAQQRREYWSVYSQQKMYQVVLKVVCQSDPFFELFRTPAIPLSEKPVCASKQNKLFASCLVFFTFFETLCAIKDVVPQLKKGHKFRSDG